MTFLIASAFTDTVQELAPIALSARHGGADVVEARVDRFREPPAQLNHFLRTHGGQTWLITCRSKPEGGLFPGDGVEAARWAFAAVRDTDAWLDVELAAWRASSELRASLKSHLEARPSARLILSAHFPDGPPANPTSLIEEALHEGAQTIAKLAYGGRHITESFEALDLMHRYGSRLIAICMGEPGVWTRLLARKLGAFATFASLEQGGSTAPGQWSIAELREQLGWDRIDAATKVFGVVGDPIAHSLSPRLFNHWFRQHNCNAVFLPFRVGADCGGLARFLAECGQRPWLDVGGLSVTIPHKVEALRWAGDAADPMSHEIGAANTLVLGESGPSAYNTDCHAAVDSLAGALGRQRSELTGLSVDVLGAGGAARAVCFGLAEMGCRVTTFSRAGRDTHDFERWGVVVHDWSHRAQGTGEVLINCTPVGMWPETDHSPMPLASLRGRKLVFDLIYRPLQTRLLLDAAASGRRTLDGLDMFVRQAATQFALWTGISPDDTGSPNMGEQERVEAGGHQLIETVLRREAHRRLSVALIGARGSGKSTAGAALAALLGVARVDTDELVMEAAGKSIAEIFAAEGEAGFRRRESEAIRSAITLAPAVIILGGGAVLDPRNVETIREAARVVWLTAPADVLAQRVAQDPKSAGQRPPLTSANSPTETADVLRVREPLYRAAADLIVDTTSRSPAQVARQIAEWIER